MAYIDYSDYTAYLGGRDAVIPEAEFGYWQNMAKVEIDKVTYGRLSDPNTFPRSKSCVIPVMAKLMETVYGIETQQITKEIASVTTGKYSESYITYTNGKTKQDILDDVISGIDYCNGVATGLRYRGFHCKSSVCIVNGCRLNE